MNNWKRIACARTHAFPASQSQWLMPLSLSPSLFSSNSLMAAPVSNETMAEKLMDGMRQIFLATVFVIGAINKLFKDLSYISERTKYFLFLTSKQEARINCFRMCFF